MINTNDSLQSSYSSGAVAAHWRGDDSSSRPASPFLIGSILFHVIVLVLVTGEFVFFSKKNEMEEMIIVEMMDAPITDKTTAPEQKPAPLTKDKAPEVEKPIPAKKATPPKSQESKPKPAPTSAPEEASAAAPDDAVPEPVPMDKAEAEKPEPIKPAPVPAKRPETKPEAPKEKAEDKPKDDKKSLSFQSVLKNLAEEQPVQSSDTVESDEKPLRSAPVLTQPPPVSEQVTQSEMQALISQLGSCWSMIAAGAKDAENLVVDIYIEVNPDRTLRSRRVVDAARYNNDSFFRAAADSAVRALHDPRCRVLNLPPYKYEQWKSMTVRFDPKQMF